jgi:tRNA/tmRNA/rRNA uracil-C5-methylase (TrmA/RlmC/RlmD family)
VLIPEIDFSTLPVESIGGDKRVEVAMSNGGERTVAVMDVRSDRSAQRAIPNIVEGKKELIYTVNKFKYQVSQESFWQSNISAPQTLVDAVLGFADLRAGDHLLDLYGGVGLFTGAALALIGSEGRADIVEGSAAATKDARHNFARYPQVNIHTGDVAREIRKFSEADVIVLDPPRTGAGKSVIEKCAGLGARAIIYVACDPAALARDTVYLTEAGYHLEAIRAFDLFPMTHHIESIALYLPSKVS